MKTLQEEKNEFLIPNALKSRTAPYHQQAVELMAQLQATFSDDGGGKMP